jgi:hypothetical protein
MIYIHTSEELKKVNGKRTNNPIYKWEDKLNRQFSEEKIQIANKYMKKCQTFLAIKKMQIKTLLTFHLTPVSWAIVKKTNDNKCWHGWCGEGIFIHHWWKYKLVHSLWKSV